MRTQRRDQNQMLLYVSDKQTNKQKKKLTKQLGLGVINGGHS